MVLLLVGTCGSSNMVVLARAFKNIGSGGLLEALVGGFGLLLSNDWRSAYASNAADSCLASVLRSSAHDLDLCLGNDPCGRMGIVFECCNIGGRLFLGDLGEAY